MPLANNALTTLNAVKKDLEIDLTDTIYDDILIQKINGMSDDIADYVRFDISSDYVLPKDDAVSAPRTLPYNIENACIELVVITYQRKGSEHLKSEVVGPLRSEFTSDWPLHIRETLDRYRVWVMV